jgi:hypothetical protein
LKEWASADLCLPQQAVEPALEGVRDHVPGAGLSRVSRPFLSYKGWQLPVGMVFHLMPAVRAAVLI